MRVAPLILLALLTPLASAQVLRSEGNPVEAPAGKEPLPLVLQRAAAEPPHARSVDEAVSRLREEMDEIADSALADAERRNAYHELYKSALPLRAEGSSLTDNPPATVNEAVDQLERLMFEVALEVADSEKTRELILEGVPEHLELESVVPTASRRKPILILRDPSAEGSWWGDASFDTEALALDEVPESPKEQLEPAEENAENAEEEASAPVAVELLADEKATVDMHDDQTILRDVTTDSGDLVLFDRLAVWVGGAVQYDAHRLDDLLNSNKGGGTDTNTSVRRAEVIVRASYKQRGEVKLQYDLDADLWRDLYVRFVDEEQDFTVTLGNFNEPMSQESLLGNKFNVAQEISAPTSTFGSWQGMGVRVNKWFDLDPGESYMLFQDKERTFVTTSFGVYGEDIENTNDTDIAATGRITFGRDRYGGSLHTGLSVTLRDGEFDRIDPRPENLKSERLVLAEFDADRAGVVGAEMLFSRGPLHLSSEAFAATYRGGEQDASGFGGFLEVGYYLTGESRGYRPKWGLWAPLQVGARNIFEVFGRASLTYGKPDNGIDNTLTSYTVGGSWYRHKIRVSINLVYSDTDQPIDGEDSGLASSLRVQYLF